MRSAGSEAGKAAVRNVWGDKRGFSQFSVFQPAAEMALGGGHVGLEQRGRSSPGMCRNEGDGKRSQAQDGIPGVPCARPGAGLDHPCGFLH